MLGVSGGARRPSDWPRRRLTGSPSYRVDQHSLQLRRCRLPNLASEALSGMVVHIEALDESIEWFDYCTVRLVREDEEPEPQTHLDPQRTSTHAISLPYRNPVRAWTNSVGKRLCTCDTGKDPAFGAARFHSAPHAVTSSSPEPRKPSARETVCRSGRNSAARAFPYHAGALSPRKPALGDAAGDGEGGIEDIADIVADDLSHQMARGAGVQAEILTEPA